MTTREELHVGIDIGGTKTHSVALSGDGVVRGEVIRPTMRGTTDLLSGIIGAVAELAGATGGRIVSLGIGIPGQVEVSSGVVRQALNLGVERWAMADAVHAAVGIRPLVDNDVNAAALGARQVLALGGTMAYLNLGTGVAAGIVLEGGLLRGSIGAAGEIGHICVDTDGPVCDCGQRGCVESLAGGRSVERAFPFAANPAVAMLDGAAAGDPHSIATLRAFAHGVTAAIHVLLLTVDVDLVVVGGGLASADERVGTTITDALSASASRSPFLASLGASRRVQVVPVDLRVPAIGAALLRTGL